jgi:predicted DNA-binding antitoxin AbrB/MazE fold protein
MNEVIIMGYKGIVKDSVIILDQGVKLPEGTIVEIIPKEQMKEKNKSSQKQSIRGKYAFVHTSSEEFARRKQQEIDLER